ncbi:hypothetical protein KCP70_07010 [Salmonella enterica subsp. enterica]|nr:hypothetical protein KCP70_07010 [Salmonella enterica subsp. enterica]
MLSLDASSGALVFHSYSSLHLLNCYYLLRVKLTTKPSALIRPISSVKTQAILHL